MSHGVMSRSVLNEIFASEKALARIVGEGLTGLLALDCFQPDSMAIVKVFRAKLTSRMASVRRCSIDEGLAFALPLRSPSVSLAAKVVASSSSGDGICVLDRVAIRVVRETTFLVVFGGMMMVVNQVEGRAMSRDRVLSRLRVLSHCDYM